MKKLIYLFAGLSLILASCEKEIDIDLDASDQKIVIVGQVTNQDFQAQVKINRSVPFDEASDFPAVTDAVVTITERIGDVETTITLNQTEPGLYKSENPLGQPGATYTLRVEADGEIYEATSTMSDVVEVSEIYFEELFPGRRFAVLDFQDIGGRKDYYKADVFIIDEQKPDIFITDDTFTDGQLNTALFGGFGLAVETGDYVRINVDHIDEANYNYWYSLSLNVSESTAAPANPDTNLSNGALGYFSAFTRTTKEAIVP
jgi:Domain of unknown function (DUF4249)